MISKQFKVLWSIMEGQRLRYSLAILAMVAGVSFSMLAPVISGLTIDGALAHKPVHAPAFVLRAIESMGGFSMLARRLWLAGLAIALLTGLSGCCGYVRGLLNARATEAIAKRLRDRLYDHMQRLPVAYHQTADTGDLVQRCTSDVETIRVFLSMQVVEIGRAWIMLLVVTPLMLWLNWRMTLVALALVPVIIAFAALFFNKVKAGFKHADEAEGAMTATLQENLTGIRVVRAFARQAFEEEKFGEKNDTLCARQRRLVRLMGIYWSTSEMLCVAQNGINLIVGGWMVARGALGVGTLFIFLSLVAQMLWPVRQMGRILTDLGKALVSIGRVQEILDQAEEAAIVAPAAEAAEAPEATEAPWALQPPTRFMGQIRFDHVSFAYKPDKPVLRDVSFTLAPGETVAIVGPTGSGKSTLARLLLRLYDQYEGTITIDGLDLRRLDRRLVREQIGTVLQQPFLYSRTIRQNIAQGADGREPGPEAIERVAREAAIHESIAELDDGYDTELGERGINLSGGQRQRVALARALLREPAILILDDALSAVDTHTEQQILRALERRKSRQTTLIITHRLSTLALANRIMVIEHGQVTQLGSHEALIAHKGLYRRLWEIQGALENELEDEFESVK